MRLSSPLTFVQKRVVPVIWLGVTGLVFLGMLASTIASLARGTPLHPTPLLGAPFTAAMLVFGYALFSRLVFDLADEVEDRGDHLRVRFGSHVERVHLADITNVSTGVDGRVVLSLRVSPGRVAFLSRSLGLGTPPSITALIERVSAAREGRILAKSGDHRDSGRGSLSGAARRR